MTHTHTVSNGKRELTLDELAMMQPGMDRLMAELGPRMHRLWFAGEAGNWPLAEYFLKSVVKQLKLCVESRPKYDPEMTAYLEQDVEPLRAAVKARDAVAFASAYRNAVDRGNHYHEVFGKPFIAWRCPVAPPDDLDLTAGL